MGNATLKFYLGTNLQVNDDAWIKKHPWEPRLRMGDANPADLGWMFL